MPDAATPPPPLVSRSYDGRKSGSGVGSDPTVEVRVRAVRRRAWSTEDRLRIVRETLEPGAVVQTVADRHGVSTGQLYTWRKQMLATAMAGFAPVEVMPEPPPALPAPSLASAVVETTGSLEIVMPSGASIRVTGAVDVITLRMVLAELGGR
ncbi:IS66-like element accessory protein TnpA [Neoroseomonas eburnea]|uniref:IS66-like element accessory protein TnpA n=1 Tax=Neoroseomonas eburnea TaxID=1346889 RepID=UPI0023510BC4|nr:transposase [Neoroseomonas eburnea]